MKSVVAYFFFERTNTTDTCTENNTDSVQIFIFDIKTRI